MFFNYLIKYLPGKSFISIPLLSGNLFLFSTTAYSQTDFKLSLEPFAMNNAPALQSFASGQYDGKWILIGGRTDGLHRRQPPFAFLDDDNNRNIYVVEPETGKVWKQSTESLPAILADQLCSTNMESHQHGDRLMMVGGYGYSDVKARHITYPALVMADLPGLIHAIITEKPIASYFTRIEHDYFAVTGGQMGMLGDTFLLAGGQWFDGRYNPHNMPSFTQQYTDQVKRFTISGEDASAQVNYLESIKDEKELHRRDYNMLPQIFKDEQQGFTMFSGVFRQDADLPFLNTVDITSSGHMPRNDFEQKLNHYHSGKFSIYDASKQTMYNIFLGGMAQYTFDSTGNMVKDDEVPFVNTIACITRNAKGEMQEQKIGEMPGLLGASAEFFIHPSVLQYENGVIKYHALLPGKNFIGYLYGGMESSAPNIFFSNTGSQSRAVNKVFKVYIIK